MNEVQIFKNEQFGQVRIVTVNNEPWFVGKDVAEALGYTDTAQALRKHIDNEDKLTSRFDNSGQNREMIIINESGLYSLVLSSKLPDAKKFKRWVTSEVLPSIRKNGGYISGQEELNEVELMAKALQVANKVIEMREFSIKLLEEQIKQDKPKVEFFDTVADSKTALTMEETAKLIGVKGFGRNKLFEFLRNKGILQRNNVPYQIFVDRGWFNVTEVSWMNKHGEPMVTTKTLVYQKGIDGISRLLKQEGKQNGQ